MRVRVEGGVHNDGANWWRVFWVRPAELQGPDLLIPLAMWSVAWQSLLCYRYHCRIPYFYLIKTVLYNLELLTQMWVPKTSPYIHIYKITGNLKKNPISLLASLWTLFHGVQICQNITLHLKNTQF